MHVQDTSRTRCLTMCVRNWSAQGSDSIFSISPLRTPALGLGLCDKVARQVDALSFEMGIHNPYLTNAISCLLLLLLAWRLPRRNGLALRGLQSFRIKHAHKISFWRNLKRTPHR